jgi:hypothetical protein
MTRSASCQAGEGKCPSQASRIHGHQGPHRTLPAWKGQPVPPQGEPLSRSTSLSSVLPESRFLGAFLLSTLSARSGPAAPFFCLRRPASARPPPLRPQPALLLTSDPVSADPRLDINSRWPESQPGDPSGPRAGARSPAQQVRGKRFQFWGRAGQRGQAGGGGQGPSRRRREQGEGCRHLSRGPPAPPVAEVRAAALVSGGG